MRALPNSVIWLFNQKPRNVFSMDRLWSKRSKGRSRRWSTDIVVRQTRRCGVPFASRVSFVPFELYESSRYSCLYGQGREVVDKDDVEHPPSWLTSPPIQHHLQRPQSSSSTNRVACPLIDEISPSGKRICTGIDLKPLFLCLWRLAFVLLTAQHYHPSKKDKMLTTKVKKPSKKKELAAKKAEMASLPSEEKIQALIEYVPESILSCRCQAHWLR